MIFCTIEELNEGVRLRGKKELKKDKPEDTFSRPRYRVEVIRSLCKVQVKGNIRFPCIHKKEPVDFH